MTRRAGSRPVGEITRGTTNPNRLRRVDNWLIHAYGPLLRDAADPLVVDLGYGATPTTAVELRARLARVRPDVRVVGLEIDPARVAAAEPAADPPWLEFRRGGFELAGLRPVLVRAFNVLRQYDESAVADAWATVAGHLAPGGVLVDGTCDELGRLGSWLTVTPTAATPDADPSRPTPGPRAPAAATPGTRAPSGAAVGPVSLTFAARLATLARPAAFAERLPKALIHRNVPGEPVHALLDALDDAWLAAAPYATFGPRARFAAAVAATRDAGWPIVREPRRWRLGELTLPWPAVTAGS